MTKYDEMLKAVEELQHVYERAASEHEKRIEKLKDMIESAREGVMEASDDGSDSHT